MRLLDGILDTCESFGDYLVYSGENLQERVVQRTDGQRYHEIGSNALLLVGQTVQKAGELLGGISLQNLDTSS
jgi:hypothetical protein